MSDKSFTTVGLDMSLSATGFCMKEGENIRLETIKTTPQKYPIDLVRLQFIVAECMNRIPKNVDLVCIEDYFTPSRPQQIGAAIKLVGLGTLMRVSLNDAEFSFFVVSPSQLKKYVTGKGIGQKSLILREVYKKWGIDAGDDNQADAAVLANIAYGILQFVKNDPENSTLDLPKYQLETIKKILKDRPSYNIPWDNQE